MHIPKAICLHCNREMQLVQAGVILEMLRVGGSGYYKISVDKYRCQDCRNEILTGFGREALAEHYQDNYTHYTATVQARFAS